MKVGRGNAEDGGWGASKGDATRQEGISEEQGREEDARVSGEARS